MTTKGYKWAIKTNDLLKDTDKKIKELTKIDNDLCRMGKIILENQLTSKFLNKEDKEKYLNKHIEKHECLQCEMFLEKHPDFFG